MIRRITAVLLCILTVFSAVLNAAAAENPEAAERRITYREDNIEANHYEYGNHVNRSFFTTADNGYMRLYGADNGTVFVEYYDSDFIFCSNVIIPSGLPIFGGFYEDENSYYVLTGQENYDENDGTEVYRLTRFNKNWHELGHASICGANTTVPFQGGCDFAQYQEHLIVRTARQMYSSGGAYHQANITLRFNTDTMTEEPSYYGVSTFGRVGYISHSFNQFVAVDTDGTVVCLDHGDYNPRSAVLGKFLQPANTDFVGNGKVDCYTGFPIVEFEKLIYDETGYTNPNITGANVGGLEISTTSYLTVGSAIDKHSDYRTNESRNAYLSITPKDAFYENSTRTIWFSDFVKEDYKCATNPHLVKMSDDRFLILWDERHSSQLVSGGKVIYDNPDAPYRMKYVFVDGEGNLLSEIMSAPEELQIFVSGAEPCVTDDKIIWFFSNEDTIDTAAVMDLDGNITLHEHIIPAGALTYPIDMNETDTVLKTFDPIPDSLTLTADNILDYVGVYKDGYELKCGEDYRFSSEADAPFTPEYENGTLKRIWLNLETVHGKSTVSVIGIGNEYHSQASQCGGCVEPAFNDHAGDVPVWTDEGVKLCYNFTRGAGYHIYRKETGGDYEKIASFGGRGGDIYYDTTAQRDKLYWYTAREYTYDKDGIEILSEPLIDKTPDAPVVSVQTTFDGVHLSWKGIEGAERYAVFRYDIDKEDVLLPALGITTECQFDFRDLGYNTEKRYAVAVIDPQQEDLNIPSDRCYSPYGLSPTVTLNNVPAVTRYECREDGLYIEWATNDFADYYTILGIRTTENHILIKNLVNQKNYYLVVQAYRSDSSDFVTAPSRSSWAPFVTFAAPGTDDWEFNTWFTDYDSTATVTGWYGSGSEVEVPGDILGAQEIVLDRTFRNNTELKKVTLPDNTTQLWNAFEGCTALQSVTIPASVCLISDNCFAGCTSLRSVIFERGSELWNIPENAFAGCESLTVYGYGTDNGAYWFAMENGYSYVDLEQSMIGDADGSGEINIMDVSVIQFDLANLYVPVEPVVLMNGDVDRDGLLEITDAAYISRYLTSIEIPYSVGSALS